ERLWVNLQGKKVQEEISNWERVAACAACILLSIPLFNYLIYMLLHCADSSYVRLQLNRPFPVPKMEVVPVLSLTPIGSSFFGHYASLEALARYCNCAVNRARVCPASNPDHPNTPQEKIDAELQKCRVQILLEMFPQDRFHWALFHLGER